MKPPTRFKVTRNKPECWPGDYYFATRKEAEDEASQLNKDYPGTWVVEVLKPPTNTPVCLLCGHKTKKKAKVISSHFTYASKEKVFCSVACAVGQALIDFNETGHETKHWCPYSGDWEYEAVKSCSACSIITEPPGYREEPKE